MKETFAKKKISQFPKADELLPTALIPIVQKCENYSMTLKEIADYVSTISGGKVQSDWAEGNASSDAFIKNKPNILTSSDIENIVNSILNGALSNYYTKNETMSSQEIKNALSNYYTKSETLNTQEINNAIAAAIAKFKVEVYNKNPGLAINQFELDANVNVSYDRSINTNISLSEVTSNSYTDVATICTVGFTNTSGGDITITIPNGGNNKSMMESVLTLESGKYVEIAMKGNGSKRVWTYLKQE